jgi:transposase
MVVEAMLAGIAPASPVEATRKDMALEHLDDLRRFDAQIRASSLTDLFGVGPVVAAIVIGHTDDIARFRSRDHFATYTGTAPIELSSGGRTVHRLSLRGNRKLNHAIHIVAVTQVRQRQSPARLLRPQAGRGQDPQRSAPDAQAPGQRHPLPPARRRRRRPLTGPGRATRDASDSSVTGSTP